MPLLVLLQLILYDVDNGSALLYTLENLRVSENFLSGWGIGFVGTKILCPDSKFDLSKVRSVFCPDSGPSSVEGSCRTVLHSWAEVQ